MFQDKSKGWEVIFLEVDLTLGFRSFSVVFSSASLLISVFPWFFFSFLSLRLGSEAQDLSVVVISGDLVLEVSAAGLHFSSFFLGSLVLLGLQDCQFFLFDPVSFDFSLLDWFTGDIAAHFDSLLAVVLVKGELFGLFGLLLFSSFFGGDDFFVSFLFVFVFFEFVVEVADVSSASSFFAGTVIAACAASAVKIVSFGGDFLGRNDFVIPLVSLVVLNVLGDFLVNLGGI